MPKSYALPRGLRSRLTKPLGTLFTQSGIDSGAFAATVRAASLVVTVGDRVTDTLAEMGRVPDVQIVDGLEKRAKRKPPKAPHVTTIRAANPAGSITEEALDAVRLAFERPMPSRVLVKGEEDLLAIPAVMVAPPGAVIYYGQPNEGIVMVIADAAAKRRSKELLRLMGWPGQDTQ